MSKFAQKGNSYRIKLNEGHHPKSEVLKVSISSPITVYFAVFLPIFCRLHHTDAVLQWLKFIKSPFKGIYELSWGRTGMWIGSSLPYTIVVVKSAWFSFLLELSGGWSVVYPPLHYEKSVRYKIEKCAKLNLITLIDTRQCGRGRGLREDAPAFRASRLFPS